MKLVIADDHKGLRAAARRVFNATHQRCRVHWMRNALAHAPAKQRTAVAAMLKTIFAQESKAEAEAQWDNVADALREKQDKLGTFMDASRDDVLAYMGLRPFDALTRPHRGHGRVSLPQTVPRTVCRFADRRELPREHWTQIASTNPLERVNREIKRRTDVVGFGGKTAPHAVFLPASLPNDEAIIVPLTRPHWGHGPPPPSGRSCSRPTTNGPSRADT